MSAIRPRFAFRIRAWGVVAACALGLLPPAARAAAPRYPDIMPLSQVKPGMKGYGLTTFKGTTISRFDVTVIGILKKANIGRDLILIRMKGGPITERQANLIHGMSGSPIYIKGKLIGAFSQGENFPREPIGMATPIEDMLEAWDPNIPQKPSFYQPAATNPPKLLPTRETSTTIGFLRKDAAKERVATLKEPIQVGNRRISKLILNARADDPRQSSAHTAVLRKATSYLSVTGIHPRGRKLLQQELDRLGYSVSVMQGPVIGSGRQKFAGVPLKPGSAFGTFVSTGDVQIGSTGTVTYRRGKRILGFGHPMMGLGALEAVITSAKILDIFPGYTTSYHIAVAGPIIGTLMQDRNFSVSGELGRVPKLIPFEVTVRDRTTKRTETFRSQIFQHPDLTPVILRLIGQEAVERVHNMPGDVMAKVTTTIDAEEVGRVTRTNLVFDANEIFSATTQDLNDITSVISGNPFYPLPITRAQMTVEIFEGHNTATLERVFVQQGRFEPGETLEIGVVLKPYRREAFVHTVPVKLPSDLPTGRYQLVVRGGMPNIIRLGSLSLTAGAQDPQTPPANVRQMIARLHNKERNTDIVARLALNSVAPAVEGEKLSQLPPNISALMRSERNSGVRLERDEIKTIQSTNYIVSGLQQLLVTVVRKGAQEPTGSGPSRPQQPGGTVSPGSVQSGRTSGSVTFIEDMGEGDETPAGEVEVAEAGSESENQPIGLAAPHDVAMQQVPGKPAPKKDEKQPQNSRNKDSKDAKTGEQPAASQKAPAPASQGTAQAADNPNEKPVGRQMHFWRQSARADFSPGKFTGTSVSVQGELRLASTLKRLATTPETYLWSLAPDGKGNLYAGTGTSGKILKITAAGGVSTFTQLPVISVQSLLMGRDGTLWAGSGVKGNLYRVQPDGSFTLAHSFSERYILALAQDSKGNVYIAPGGGGTVYRVSGAAANATPEPFIKTNADHILALATDAQDNLYIGTGDEGILYRVAPDGKSTVLYDSRESSITAVAVDAKGNAYIGTSLKGVLYCIAPDGTATTLFDRATSFFTAIKPAPDGTLYASAVNAIYHIVPAESGEPSETTVLPLDNPKDVDFLTLAISDGMIYTGTGNVGEVYTSPTEAKITGPRRGTFESVAHDAKLVSRWGIARWSAQLPAGTRLSVETRSGNVSEPDSSWSGWTAVRQESGAAEAAITSQPARFIQYRVTLEADNPTADPLVREITLNYLPRNQAPKVTFQTPAGGERWARNQTIRWAGDDPDRDTLTYELYYSPDAGQTWKPLPGDSKPVAAAAGQGSAGAPAANSPAGTAPQSEAEKKIADDGSIPENLRKIMLDSVRQRAGGSGNGSGAASLRENSKSLDTKSLPDGTYWLKVVATDRASNAIEPQSAQSVSEPFVICNATPKLAITTNQEVKASRSVALEGTVSQPLVGITAVQYRVDGGDWMAATAKDGLFDSSREGFLILTSSLAAGKHTVEIKAFNASNLTAVEKVEITIQ